jgi:hypothetical protein
LIDTPLHFEVLQLSRQHCNRRRVECHYWSTAQLVVNSRTLSRDAHSLDATLTPTHLDLDDVGNEGTSVPSCGAGLFPLTGRLSGGPGGGCPSLVSKNEGGPAVASNRHQAGRTPQLAWMARCPWCREVAALEDVRVLTQQRRAAQKNCQQEKIQKSQI